jgi:hypothetical protein
LHHSPICSLNGFLISKRGSLDSGLGDEGEEESQERWAGWGCPSHNDVEIVFKHYITLYNFQWGRLKYNISGTKLED